MSVSSVQNVSFKGNCNCKSCQKKTGGALPAICSVPVSGLGQLVDGRGRKGAKYFLTTYGSYALGGLLSSLAMVANNKGSKAGAIAAGIGSVAALFAGGVSHIASIIDAAKGEKCENKVDVDA